jgi:hypothetical protein
MRHRTRGVVQVAEHLPSKNEVLSCNPVWQERSGRKEGRKEGMKERRKELKEGEKEGKDRQVIDR